ncbi:hypothetical protein BABINDRAFT_161746 [Babjeviella inositovora NRRL Y-12698]|uniref:Uncharacterized protein n=1 Tax=Babjeviella inositovora NRRL Y-12698 TaxID=984486 RepID=A0A1E3QNX3_9ASCO|nr:uncharacterized protein BABINDRAFT_161746 [Babjeviella inositovora NRRL Y-12698]ODQ79338.1 hypothetical protein BABINDRAFT_161746 [Babjeviella inositovora NRRL Y-12698]
MAEEQRKLLEQLMGRDALINPSRQRRDPSLTDTRVCKSFIVGTCPHDLFLGTKQDFGKCPKFHLEKHKMEYEALRKQGHRFPEFDYEYTRDLEQYINDCNRKIEVALQRLEHTPEEKVKIAHVTQELDNLDAKIGLMTQEIQMLSTHQELTKALLESVKLNALCQEREQLAELARDIADNIGQASQQKLQVCEMCGAYLSRLDSDRRLADHFIGKIHLGYVHMRRALDEMRSKVGRRY